MIFTIDALSAGRMNAARSRAGALIREGAARVNGSVPRGFLREKEALA